MPRAPAWQPNQIAPVDVTEARFRPANNNGGVAGGLAEGLSGMGNALANYADAQDRLNAQNDDTQSRLMAANAQSEAESIKSTFTQLQAGAARAGQVDADKSLDAIRDKFLSQASNPRMKRMLEERLLPVLASARSRISEHSIREQKVERKASFEAQEKAAGESALGATDPRERDVWVGKAVDARFAALRDDGFTPEDNPEVFGVARVEATSGIHANVLDGMFADPDPKLDEIAGYVEAYGDEMTAGLRNDVLKRMQGPLQGRITRSDADLVGTEINGALQVGTRPALDTPTGEWQGVAVNVANRFGLDPSDVAAVMSYETGGSFSPTVMGGKGGRYMGLIQFGEWERKKYGIDKTSTPAQWAKAIGDFLDDRGFRKGMGLADLYSTINAGQPGRYGASDGNGTVATHVEKIIAQHKTKAMEWLGKSGAAYDNAPRSWDRAKVYDALGKVADREGWSPERTERAREEWDRRITRDEGLLNEQYATANDEATRIIAGMPNGLSDISQLPRSVRDRMDPTDVAKLQEGIREQRQAAAKDAQTAANERVKLELEIERRLEPEKFKRRNLLDLTGKLTPAELTSQFIAQQELRQKPVAQDEFRGGIQSAITWAKKYDQVEVEDKDFPAVYDLMRGYLVGLKRAPSQQDYSDAFRHATTATAKTTTAFMGIPTGSSEKPIYKVDSVPPNFRAQFIQRFPGGKPSEAQILEGYRRWLDR